MTKEHALARSVRTHDQAAGLESLEQRVVLDSTGYFAGGVVYNGDLTLFREFGEFDDETGDVAFGSREDSDGGFSGSPWAGFDFGGPSAFYEGSIRYASEDAFASRVTVGFGSTPFGFSVGYSGDDYATPIDLNYLMRQPTDLQVGSGGRDGSYFFSGVVENVSTGAWMFNHGSTTIDGLSFEGSQTFESGEMPFSYALDPNGIFADGYTTFSDSTSVAFFGSDLRFALQTDLDGSDGFRSYSLGFRTEPETSFTADDFAGDIYGLSLTGGSFLANFFGLSAGSSDAFTYTGALEFADGGTFRMYDLDEFYSTGRDADTIMTGAFTVDGDEVRLTSLDGSRSADLRFSPDLTISAGVGYTIAGHEYLTFGGGPRIGDGQTGDYSAVDSDGGDGGDDLPTLYNFRSVTPVIGLNNTHYILAETDDDQDVRFDVSSITGLDFTSFGLSAWLPGGRASIGALGVTGAGVHYIERGEDGLWTTDLLTSSADEVFATLPAFGRLVEGGKSFGGFNLTGDLLRYDFVDDNWDITVLDDIPAPDGEPAAATDAASLLITPWNGWHLLYLDSVGSLRAAWTAPGLDTYYNNDLSLRAGMDPIDGTGIDVALTDWSSIQIGVVSGGSLHGVWWQPSFAGNWVDTDFTDVLGADGGGLAGDFVGTRFDRATGDLYKFAATADRSDMAVFHLPLGGAWAHHTVRDSLGLTGYTVPDAGTIVLGGLRDDGRNLSLRGVVGGLDDLPILSHLFSNRRADQLDESLLIFLMPSLMEPNDGE